MLRLPRSLVLLAALLSACARGAAPPPAVAELESMWALYLEPVSSTLEAEYATAQMRNALLSQRRFVIVHSPDQAHAIVRVTIAFQQADAAAGDPALLGEINREGSFQGYQPPFGSISLLDPESEDRVIWSRTYVAPRSRHRQTNPAAQTLVSSVVSQLGGRLHRAAGRRVD